MLGDAMRAWSKGKVGGLAGKLLERQYNVHVRTPEGVRRLERLMECFGDLMNEHELAILFLAEMVETVPADHPRIREELPKYIQMSNLAYETGHARNRNPQTQLFEAIRNRFGINPFAGPHEAPVSPPAAKPDPVTPFHIARENARGIARELPRCTGWISIATRGAQANHKGGPVLAQAWFHDWALESFDNTEGRTPRGAERSQLLLVLTAWLELADTTANQVTTLPDLFGDLIEEALDELVNCAGFKLHCPTCASYHDFVVIEAVERMVVGPNVTTTRRWSCPKRHPVYERVDEMRFHFSPG